MSQTYKFKSLQIAENGKDEKQTQKDPNSITVFKTGDTKTIDFILKDGTRQNFTYSHYITAWLGKEGDDRIIKIFFATHVVTIKGFCLDEIYNALTAFKLKLVKVNDKRYMDDFDENKAFVTDIKVIWRKQE